MKTNLAILLLMLVGFAKAQTKQQENSKPFILGAVDELYSKELTENRTLNIYLPAGYNPNDTIKYPVIYLLDGSADEDFIHIVGLVQYYSFEWIDLVPPSIVVGISTVDRKRDFTFPSQIDKEKTSFPSSGHSDKFISFIGNELQPFIEKKYKTNDKKTIVGQSLGGLLATEILLTKPNLFDKYIIVSPSLWWNDGSILNSPQVNFQNTDIYIGVGKEGLAPSSNPHVMEVDANLLAEKLTSMKQRNVKVFFDYLPEENHATIMHQAVLNAFKKLYAK